MATPPPNPHAILLQQRIATGKHRHVDIENLHSIADDFPFVDAQPDGAGGAFIPKFRKRLEASATRQLVPVMRVPVPMCDGTDVVNVENIRLQNAKTLLTGLKGP